MIKPFLVPATVLCLGVLLGACSSVSGFVSDHWPHWAGGMPDDVPPRPGAPGYDAFIAHAQANKDASVPAAAVAPAPVAPVAAAAPTAVVTPAAQTNVQETAASGDRPGNGADAMRGGLY